MAQEERVVSRRDPEITSAVLADGRTFAFKAYEIPRWRARNDFGNEVVQQYTKAMNEWVHSVQTEDESIILAAQAFEAVMDYDKLFLMGYGWYGDYTLDNKQITPPPADVLDAFEQLDFPTMIAVLVASLKVNGLEQQLYMLDRRSKGQSQPESLPKPSADAGQKMESSAVSG